MLKLSAIMMLVLAVVIAPELVSGNPKCKDIGFGRELKAEYGSGEYSNGEWAATFEITTTAAFTSNLTVWAAIVKAGPYAHIYRFPEPISSFGDLDGPFEYDISHVTLCREPSTAIDLIDYGVRVEGDSVVIYWESANELTTLLYEVLRDDAVIAQVPPQMPGSVIGAAYTVTDTLGCATYILRATETDDTVTEFQLGRMCPSRVSLNGFTAFALSSFAIPLLLVAFVVLRRLSKAEQTHI